MNLTIGIVYTGKRGRNVTRFITAGILRQIFRREETNQRPVPKHSVVGNSRLTRDIEARANLVAASRKRLDVWLRKLQQTHVYVGRALHIAHRNECISLVQVYHSRLTEAEF